MPAKWVPLFLFVMNFPCLLQAVQNDYPSANRSTKWINNDLNAKGSIDFVDGSTIRPILLVNRNLTNSPAVGCGFYGNRTTNSFFFVVFAVQATSDSTIVNATPPQILWTTKSENPLKENATLEFTRDGILVLSDANGKDIWDSNNIYYSNSYTTMDVTACGTLRLSNYDTNLMWDSWDYPTDTWLPGQKITTSGKLMASISASNLAPGSLFLSVDRPEVSAYINSDPPQKYREIIKTESEKKFKTGSLVAYPTEMNGLYVRFESEKENFQFLRLDPDGHLRAYQWVHGAISVADDILTDKLGNCSYPTVCGNYGICTNGKCSCPVGNDGNASYFRRLSSGLGCEETTPVSCQSSPLHSFIQLDEVSYFDLRTDLNDTDVESCKQACLSNCSCKGAFFTYISNTSGGNCSLQSEIFSLMRIPQGFNSYNSTSFIKVVNSSIARSPPLIAPSPYNSVPESPSHKSKNIVHVLVLVSIVTVGAVFFICIGVRCIRKRRFKDKKQNVDEEWERSLLRATNMPRRFTYQDLKSATDDFHKKIGGGGFGSVFEGTLSDGTKIAVKCLDRSGQGRKEFLAEVKTIGSIHHVNLMRLVGFCAENSHRILVYQYMSNGSLDKWIFNRNPETALEWKLRKKVVLNIAKGLAYLHEDCEMRIAHLDIKPQNILLDDSFNAKLSDFGLARLIDRNQSRVTTQMRGTRGYMAPEWLSGKISEKVDVYSFGIVILEVICGRKNLDLSQQNEDDHLLLPIVKRKAEENQLIDLVDKHGEDMQQHVREAVEMIRIAIWCLHNDPNRRPSMSMVLKALEGGMIMEPTFDYSSLTSNLVEAPRDVVMVPSTPQQASILSGPR